MQTDLRLFGLNLQPLWQDAKASWQAMARWSIVRWLSPTTAVRVVLGQDGGPQLWRGGRQVRVASAAAVAAARYVAVLLPEELLLRRQVHLPKLTVDQAQQALALDAQASSPFGTEQLLHVHTWQSSHQGRRAELVLTSRALVDAHLSQFGLDPARTEVWVPMADDRAAVLPGYGEGRRERHMRFGRWLAVLLAALCVMWLAAMAVTPTLQLRVRALQAVQAFDALAQQAAPVVAQREAMLLAQARAQQVQAIQAKGVEVLPVLSTLTRALPDESSLLTLQVQGQSVRMTGQTPNAAELMKQLGTVERVANVTAPSPATRPPGATKESFNIELTYLPPVVVPAQAGAAQ